MFVMCPFLYCNCDGPTSPPTASVSVSFFYVLDLFSATPSSCQCVSSALASSLLASSSLCCCCCASCLSLASTGYLPLCPKLKFRNTWTWNFYLHSSAFLRTHCQIISNSVFLKNKILKYTEIAAAAMGHEKNGADLSYTVPDLSVV